MDFDILDYLLKLYTLYTVYSTMHRLLKLEFTRTLNTCNTQIFIVMHPRDYRDKFSMTLRKCYNGVFATQIYGIIYYNTMYYTIVQVFYTVQYVRRLLPVTCWETAKAKFSK